MRQRQRCLPVLIFCLLAFLPSLWGQEAKDYIGQFVPERWRPAEHETIAEFHITLPAHSYYLVKLDKQAGAGYRVLRRLSGKYRIVALEDEQAANIFQWILPANDDWKLSPVLLSRAKRKAPEERRFLVKVDDMAEFEAFLAAEGLETAVLSRYTPAEELLLKLPSATFFDVVLPFPGLIFADERGGAPREERAIRDLDLSVNKVSLLHARHPALNGEGLGVSVKEFRFDSSDIDFRGRYLPSELGAEVLASHATTMATMIAGGGNSFYTGKGVAWGADISSSSFLRVFPDEIGYFDNSALSVQNHSYGLGIENYYGGEALAYDQQVFENPYLMHVFSAGNIGDSTSTEGAYQDVPSFANLSGNFKMAKNILAIGSVDSLIQVDQRSSRGPAFDGRVKPELVAFGQDGSSGAAAITSGLCLLLQQAYRDTYSDELPPAALLRAVLLNSADDLSTPGPDYTSGYGNLNAWRAVNTIVESRFFSGTAVQGEEQTFVIELPADVAELKITLAWTGPPGQVNGARALVNDLSMSLVRASTGEQWLPWVLSTFPHPDSLQSPARRGIDELNNQEQISITLPAAGRYEITVRGFEVPQGPQPFFIAYEWDTLAHFEWAFPARKNNISPLGRAPLRWESSAGPEDAGRLEYKLVGEQEWTLIADGLPLSDPFFFWQAPDTVALAQLRMLIGGKAVLTDTFSISAPLEMELGLECEDSLLLSWNKAKAGSYQLYSLEENSHYLEAFQSTADTFLVIDKSKYPSRFYAVAPLIQPGFSGERSYTLNLDFQFAGCYLKLFQADLREKQVELSLSLGSVYQVKSIIFEKRLNGQFLTLGTLAPNGQLEYTFLDTAPKDGYNIYRAVIELEDGRLIYSEEDGVTFSSQPFFVFPNPVEAGREIGILAQNAAGAEFFLYDTMGRLVRKRLLFSERSFIPTEGLAGGVYFYQVVVEGKKQSGGKVIIR